jgi:hypothetical protein
VVSDHYGVPLLLSILVGGSSYSLNIPSQDWYYLNNQHSFPLIVVPDQNIMELSSYFPSFLIWWGGGSSTPIFSLILMEEPNLYPTPSGIQDPGPDYNGPSIMLSLFFNADPILVSHIPINSVNSTYVHNVQYVVIVQGLHLHIFQTGNRKSIATTHLDRK